MKNSNEIYKQALNQYHNGFINKAIQTCADAGDELFLSSSLLNLKGLLHYIKGEMNEARKLWTINYEKNLDQVSKRYLISSENDEYYIQLYKDAIGYIKDMKISMAIENLEICRENTNFNSVNVNNKLFECYLKKAEYDKALKAIDSVFKLDKRNLNAKNNYRKLQKLGLISKTFNKNLISGVVSFVSVVIILGTVVTFKNRVANHTSGKKEQKKVAINKNNDQGKQIKASSKMDKEIKKEDNKNSNKSKQDKAIINTNNNKISDKEEKFPLQELKNAISANDYNKMHLLIQKWNNKNIGINDKVTINEAKSLMDKKGALYYYNLGRDNSKAGKFNEAIKYYNICILYSIGHCPYEDGLYMLGVCYKKTSNTENAIKTYERYYTEYKNKSNIKDGTYIKEVLYYLINTYKSLNNEKYKMYENELKSLG